VRINNGADFAELRPSFFALSLQESAPPTPPPPHSQLLHVVKFNVSVGAGVWLYFGAMNMYACTCIWVDGTRFRNTTKRCVMALAMA
jgi:hypothetical protein